MGQLKVGSRVTVGVTLGQHLPTQPYVTVGAGGCKGQWQFAVLVGARQAIPILPMVVVTVGQAGKITTSLMAVG